jgi:hypothetical protein
MGEAVQHRRLVVSHAGVSLPQNGDDETKSKLRIPKEEMISGIYIYIGRVRLSPSW